MVQIDYPTLIAALDREAKIYFYSLFARNLTVTSRTIASDPALPATDCLERLRWLNEINHRVLNRLLDLLQTNQIWTEKEVWDLIAHHAAQHPAVGQEVGFAIEHSYAALLKWERDG